VAHDQHTVCRIKSLYYDLRHNLHNNNNKSAAVNTATRKVKID